MHNQNKICMHVTEVLYRRERDIDYRLSIREREREREWKGVKCICSLQSTVNQPKQQQQHNVTNVDFI